MNLRSKGKVEESSTGNRSDDVRRRRSERKEQRVTKATQRAAQPVRVRPVVMRGNAFGTPVHRRTAKTAPRRAFYVTMDSAAGTELRLPSLPMIRPGWRLLSGLIVIAALVGIYSFWNSVFFLIGGVEVVGLERISAEEINDQLRFEGYSIIEIDPRAVSEKISSEYPELLAVKVNVELPNYVTLQATERQPVIAWQQGDQLKWLDAEGVAFQPRGDAGPLVTIHSDDTLPLVPLLPTTEEEEAAQSGEESQGSQETDLAKGPRRVDPVLLEAVQGLSQKLPPETQLAFSSENGLGWVEQNGSQVFIGTDLSNFEAKYNMYQQLASHLAAQGQQPHLVSVEHIDAPFYRLEP